MLKQTVEYRWRNKKTGRYVKAKSKGSKRVIFSALRWGKGTPKAGQYMKEGVRVYEPKQFEILQDIPFKKERGTLLFSQFGRMKVYRKVIKSKAKVLEVMVSGKVKGEPFKTKFLIPLFGKPTSAKIRDMLVGRTLRMLRTEGIRLSSNEKKKESYRLLSEEGKEKVYTPSEYANLKLLRNIKITLEYV